VRAYYVGYNIVVLERTDANGKRRADLVVCEGPHERFRHKMLAMLGRYGTYNIVSLERERFVPGGVHVKERIEL
jgi:hypothetical protein